MKNHIMSGCVRLIDKTRLMEIHSSAAAEVFPVCRSLLGKLPAHSHNRSVAPTVCDYYPQIMKTYNSKMTTQHSSDIRNSQSISASFVTPHDAPVTSRKYVPKFNSNNHRIKTAAAFEKGSDIYHAVRPNYPNSVIELLNLSPNSRVLDIGCGTGKLTEQIAQQTSSVYALDPSKDMLDSFRSTLDIPSWQATAEQTAVSDSRFSTLTCAQTWHWVEPLAASAELDRISTNDAQLLLVWNTLDISVPWVHRLSRIMHSGDTLAEGFIPHVAQPWELVSVLRGKHAQELYPDQIHTLAHTRSYWLRASEKTREKLTHNLSWYLTDHLELPSTSLVEIPYRFDAFLYKKAPVKTQ
ncbi:methyltransferase domain-containing protein [Corynebacterium diphtheriae]|nr:methyltransferase domain-containing protein [Corynebacterium diphtheriae]